MVDYTLTTKDGASNATIFIDGEAYPVNDKHARWDRIKELLLDGSTDETKLLGLVTPGSILAKTFARLSDRIAVRGGKLTFDGVEDNGALADHIMDMIESGADEADYLAYVNLRENLATNPSQQSQDHFFHFIEKHGIVPTPDGHFIAYKGTKKDGTSVHAGYGIVDGVEYTHAHLPNYVGAVVEIPRNMVDDNRGVACSSGLHAGSFDYANWFLTQGNPDGKVFVVKINPRDVVSVPYDHDNKKLRISKYVVIAENPGQKYEGLTYIEEVQPVPVVEQPAEEVEETPQPVVNNVTVNVTETPKRASSGAISFEERVVNMTRLIETLLAQGADNKTLRRTRSKTITAANRAPFDKAAADLGISF